MVQRPLEHKHVCTDHACRRAKLCRPGLLLSLTETLPDETFLLALKAVIQQKP